MSDAPSNPAPLAGAPSHGQLALRAARPGRVRDLALRVYVAARADWGGADATIPRTFREARHLHSSERRFVAEALYGLIRNRRTVRFLLDRGGVREEAGPPGLADWLGWLVLGEGLDADRAAAAWRDAGATGSEGFGAVARGPAEIAAWAREEAPAPAARLGVEVSLPDWLAERLLADFGEEEARELARAMNGRAPLTVHANVPRIGRDELVERLAREGAVARPSRLSDEGVTFVTRANVFALDAYKEGLFWMQDEGSQLIADAVAPPPRGFVVDACAGAGGKTLALSAALGNRGRLLALDVRGHALDELRRRARRAGVANARTVEIAERGPLPPEVARFTGRADRVLVDAPCSGTGVLRRTPEGRWRLHPAEVEAFPARQAEILDRMAPLVAPGGRLIYATCSVLRAENEAVVDRFLGSHADFVLMPLDEVFGRARAERVGDGTVLRVLPHRHGTDGFFAAVMRRRREG